MDYREIYRSHAEDYQSLIAFEDCEGLVQKTVREAVREGASFADIGAGTGRLSAMVVDLASSLALLDESQAMLDVARDRLQAMRPTLQPSFLCSDYEKVALETNSIDVVAAGWALGHLTGFHEEDWKTHTDRAVNELLRIAKPGGQVLIFETLGTCAEEPAQMRPLLAAFYESLKKDFGFEFSWVRTDYLFPDVETAVAKIGFFFGETKAQWVKERDSNRVPECTAVFRKRV